MRIQWPEGTYPSNIEKCYAILFELRERGPVDQRHATNALAKRLAERKIEIPALRPKLKFLESLGALSMLTVAKDTVMIELNPELELPAEKPSIWRDALPLRDPPAEPASLETKAEPEDPPEEEEELPAASLAQKLLFIMRLAGEVLDETGGLSDNVIRERLAETLAENARMRSKLRAQDEDIKAYTDDLRLCRQRIQILETNLASFQGQQVNDSGFKELNKLMRAPTTEKER